MREKKTNSILSKVTRAWGRLTSKKSSLELVKGALRKKFRI